MAAGQSALEIMARDAMLAGQVYLANYTYSASWLTGTGTALGASATVESDIQINADSDFITQEINIQAWSAAGTLITSPDYLITLVNTGSGRQCMNQAQPVTLYCGGYAGTNSVALPNELTFPILFTANTTIAITLQNRTATPANRVDVCMNGLKVYYIGGNRQKIFNVM